jgi:drug/metabolite transporter (DMT)-like permease
MDWFSLTIVSIFLFSIANLLQRVLMRGEGSDYFLNAFSFQVLCAILVGIISIVHGFKTPDLPLLLPNYILLSLAYGLGSLALFKGFKTTEASSATIFSSTRAVWTILLAVTVFGETLSMNHLLGAILIIGAIIFINFKKGKIKLGRGALYILLAALLYGLEFANDGYIIKHSDAFSFLLIGFWLPVIPMFIIKPKVILGLKGLIKSPSIKPLLLLGAVYSTQAVFTFLPYQLGGQASVLGPLQQSTTILTIILAAIFLKERGDILKKVIGAILVTGGVILLR